MRSFTSHSPIPCLLRQPTIAELERRTTEQPNPILEAIDQLSALENVQLMNGVEVALGTDPCNPDTDGDGFPDDIDIDPFPTDPGGGEPFFFLLAVVVIPLYTLACLVYSLIRPGMRFGARFRSH